MIHTVEELYQQVDDDFIWRRRELSTLKALVGKYQEDQLYSKVLIRGAIALLYAHWEGFVKTSSSLYLEYVASHRLTYRQLATNFVGLTLRSKFNELNESKKMSSGNEMAHFFCTKLDDRSNIPYKNGVDTKSNLSSKVLVDIVQALGLDATPFETSLNFIDANLVNSRNQVAHGEALDMSFNEYVALHDKVEELINSFKNQVQNAASLNKFRRDEITA